MKKKLLISILIVIFCFTLVGCGKTKEESKETNTNASETTTDNSNDSTNGSSSSDEEVKLYSDNTKYVFEFSNTKYVFYYSGDKITAYHTYVDYNDSASAKAAYQLIKMEDYPEVKNITLKGKYIVFEWAESEYEDLTASNIRTAYSYMKEVKQ